MKLSLSRRRRYWQRLLRVTRMIRIVLQVLLMPVGHRND